MKKKTLDPEEKIEKQDFDLFKAIEAIDRKDYNWFNELSDEQKKKFVPYMLLRWVSAVKATSSVSGYYLMSTDFNANKYMFNERVGQHPELQWLMLCASSPGIGKQFHQWIPQLNEKIASLKERAKTRDIQEYFEKIYKGADQNIIKEYAVEFTGLQNKKCRLAELYPQMKLCDIEFLANIVTNDDLDDYDKEAGN